MLSHINKHKLFGPLKHSGLKMIIILQCNVPLYKTAVTNRSKKGKEKCFLN